MTHEPPPNDPLDTFWAHAHEEGILASLYVHITPDQQMRVHFSGPTCAVTVAAIGGLSVVSQVLSEGEA